MTQNQGWSDLEGTVVSFEKTSHFTNEEMKAKIAEVSWPRSFNSFYIMIANVGPPRDSQVYLSCNDVASTRSISFAHANLE